jgi:hypothetical protein
MNKTLAAVAFLALLALYLFTRPKAASNITQGADTKFDEIPSLKYEVPPVLPPAGNQTNGSSFDWLGGSGCHCDAAGNEQKVVVWDTVTTTYENTGYIYLSDRLNYTPVLKHSPILLEIPKRGDPNTPGINQPRMIQFIPKFHWAWSGLTRIIRTSDGLELYTGFENRAWTRDDGGSIIDPITAIKFNGIRYILDTSANEGLSQ